MERFEARRAGLAIAGALAAVLVAVLAGTACLEAAPPEQLAPVVVASASDGQVTADLLVRGAAGLSTGRNTIALRLTDDATGAPITAAAITQRWHMAMAPTSHGCPAPDPAGVADEDGLFLGTVVLPMPSVGGAPWGVTLTVMPALPAGAAEHVLELADLAVAASDRVRLVDGDDGGRYLVTLSFAEGAAANGAPALGDNAYVLTVHTQSGELDYTAVEDATVQAVAEMPAMGHGAAAPPAPAHRDDGEYVGAVDLSMPGAWRVTFTLARAGAPLGVVAFDLEL